VTRGAVVIDGHRGRTGFADTAAKLRHAGDGGTVLNRELSDPLVV
jgi:hypothetical protein